MSDCSIIGVERTPDRADEVLTPDALQFLAALHHEFAADRRALLAARIETQQRFDRGELPRFLDDTKAIRSDDGWSVAPPAPGLEDRRVEITGPVERKMMINALNSGARVFMADFEDANTATWSNCINGQLNVQDAVRRTLELDQGEKQYRLNERTATLMLRPRGWHLEERHLQIGDAPASGSLFDFGLAFFHNAKEQLDRGVGPYFYLPKLESHREAQLWNRVFCFSQDYLGVPSGSIRATVLIETITAAFEMEEILFELREHSAGLNAGRWDYIFSVIKKFRERDDFVLPDRSDVTMTVPFMRAYTELLVKTCHSRGAHAMGGMAAFIPSRRDAEVNESAIRRVREDKTREAAAGFDGTWVAHPDLVPVAMEAFDEVLQDRPNQIARRRDDVVASADDLLAISQTPGSITDQGLRTNISVGVRYLASWLSGNGAAAIDNLMEDAATAEICRSQVWQWLRHERVARADVDRILAEVATEVEDLPNGSAAVTLFAEVACSDDYVEFLTLPAYALLAD